MFGDITSFWTTDNSNVAQSSNKNENINTELIQLQEKNSGEIEVSFQKLPTQQSVNTPTEIMELRKYESVFPLKSMTFNTFDFETLGTAESQNTTSRKKFIENNIQDTSAITEDRTNSTEESNAQKIVPAASTSVKSNSTFMHRRDS